MLDGLAKTVCIRCTGSLEEAEVIPPGVAQYRCSAEGREQNIHLNGAPYPECCDGRRRLHDVKIAVLVARMHKVASGSDCATEEGEVAQKRETVGELDVCQIDEKEEDWQSGSCALENLAPDDVLAVLAVDKHVGGEVHDSHAQRVENAFGQGPQRLFVVEGTLTRRCIVLVNVPARLLSIGQVEFALALLGELEQCLALWAGAVGVLEDHVDAVFVELVRRLEGGACGCRIAGCGLSGCTPLFAVAAHGLITTRGKTR